MKKALIALFLLSPLVVFASEQSTCTTNKGAFLTGSVTTAPKFQAATQTIQGIQVSHTVMYIKADQDGKSYQVAMDNVYASDYVKNATSVPASLAALKAGTRVEVCGQKYSDGSGIHWVHNNCGETPTASAPNGWVKTIASSGSVGANLERSQAYCYLWN
ncbi:hypothetical protein HH212_14420 [Massilia forsythiae]|uniref:DUF3465 domain-containing protein n=1 Tax=Massilia forsythiae TaxID=2728020 RepID=A0A7Z2ZT09_9BURK|nr:hypothetical protein [Massilia forsythiae]QJE01078.1 hypothetical protein HH212_14420 [Massilia forsythiae]